MQHDQKIHASVSVFIPALNEEKTLTEAVQSIRRVLNRLYHDREILIFNDGSTDRTGAIAEELARGNTRIRVFHHATPQDIGGCCRRAIRLARKKFFVMFPGDNENDAEAMVALFRKTGQSDMIIPFPENPEVRPFIRRVLSRVFVWILNRISGLHLKYYNGTVLYRIRRLRESVFVTDGFGYQAEILTRLIQRGCSYQQVSVRIRPRPRRCSRALSFSNFMSMGVFYGAISAVAAVP